MARRYFLLRTFSQLECHLARLAHNTGPNLDEMALDARERSGGQSPLASLH